MNKPVYYSYIAILEYEEDGVHITFPDLPGCVSFGENEIDAIQQAREVLALHLWGIEDDGEVPPAASSIKSISDSQQLQKNEAYLVVDTFMPAIREKMANRFVKKTLSIPAWLNSQAENCGINFSQTLQKALKQELKKAY